MPSVQPGERTWSFHDNAAAATEKLDATALDAQIDDQWAAFNDLLTALAVTIRSDNTLVDEIVRLRNFHPEVIEYIDAAITGPVGPQGEKGDKGDKGDPSTVPGPQGETGPAGQAWASGPESAAETYPSGPPEGVKYFFTFTTGDIASWSGVAWTVLCNITGPIGLGWNAGTSDPVGTPSDNMVWYLNTTTGYIWQYYSAAWHNSGWTLKGAQGNPGTNGTDGAPGGPWLKGSGVPSSGTGSDGDWYLDTATEKVYEKQSGSWAEIADFSGGGGGVTAPLVLPAAGTTGLTMPGAEGGYDWRFYANSGAFRLEYQSAGGDWNSAPQPFAMVGGEEMVFTPGSEKFNSASGRQVIFGPGIVDAAVEFQVAGTTVVQDRITGWGAPTGAATRSTFATGSVTTEQLAERVKALIDDLTTHGLIGPTP